MMSINRTNTLDPFIHHEIINEWDIKSANTSLMRYYNLIDSKLIDKFEKMNKQHREEAVGRLSKKDKDFSKLLEKSFNNIINEFMEINNLDFDKDIIAIKKDAVFVRNKEIRHNIFGNGAVNFINKNTYSGCLLIPNYEFYYSKDKIDVKGINDNSIHYHQDGVLSLISLLMQNGHNWIELNQLLKDYAQVYKQRQLPFNAYREFNSLSKFRVNLYGEEILMDDIDEDLIEDVNISFNYLKIYLPILKILIK